MSRNIGCAAALILLAAPVWAQEAPPLGVWLEPGQYCANGVRALVPEGFEAISFGAGLEMRRAGGEGRTFVELLVLPRAGGMPDFAAIAAMGDLPCESGFVAATNAYEQPGWPAVRSIGFVDRVCANNEAAYGVYMARAALRTGGAAHDVSITVSFGDGTRALGGVRFGAESGVTEIDAMELRYSLARGLGPCRAPAAPEAAPEAGAEAQGPTDWLGAGDHCAFGVGASVPSGIEARFNGLAANGGSIDFRRAGADADGFHRYQLLIRDLPPSAPRDPRPGGQAYRLSCVDGFALDGARERESVGVTGGSVTTLTHACRAPSGAAYGRIAIKALPNHTGGAYEIRGEMFFGSPDLPPTISLTEFDLLTEAEALSIVDGFVASIHACETGAASPASEGASE